MTATEYVEKYCGQFPDTEGRKIAKTWDELRELMKSDLNDLLRKTGELTLEKAAENARVRFIKDANNDPQNIIGGDVVKISITDPSNIVLPSFERLKEKKV